MSEKENLETVREAYAAFRRGDLEAFVAFLADDVDWVMPEVPGIPFTGNCRGRTQVEEFFRALAEAEDVIEFTQDRFVVTGDRVAVTGRYRVRVRATHRTVETRYAHFFTVVDGKIHAFEEYYDTAAVADAHRQRRARAGDR